MADTAKDGARLAYSGSDRSFGGLIAALAAFAVFAALLNNFLRFNNYPVLVAEVGLVALVALGAALLYGLIYALAGRFPPLLARAGRAALEALLVVYALSLSTERLTYLLAAGFAVVAAVLLTRRSILPFAGVMALIVLITANLGIGQQREPAIIRANGTPLPQPSSAAVAAEPAIVHIILDEHIGVEGLPSDNPASPALAKDLRSFYLARGFRLFGGAYSQHFHTTSSIPQILNLGVTQPASAAFKHVVPRLAANAYFSLLRRKGYRLHVYQSEYINYCAGQEVATCIAYSPQNLSSLATASSLSAPDKARLILGRLHARSLFSLAGRIIRVLDRKGLSLPGTDFGREVQVTPVNALSAFELFVRDLRRAQPGNFYFAHILLPHYPYATLPDCRFASVARWQDRRSAQPRSERERAYFNQVRCAMSKVSAAFAAVSQSPAADNFVLIVHGDHGSRITDADPELEQLGRISIRDFTAGFSTLFAVRASGVAPGYEKTKRPVAGLLAALARSDFRETERSVAEEGEGSVFLEDRNWVPREQVPLPAGFPSAH